MKRSETAMLLAVAAAFDQRTIGDADVIAWYDVLSRWNFDDAKNVIRDFYSHDHERRVSPGHINDTLIAEDLRRKLAERGSLGGDHCGNPDCDCTHTDECDRGWMEPIAMESAVVPCPRCRPGRSGKPGESRAQWQARIQLEDSAWAKKQHKTANP